MIILPWLFFAVMEAGLRVAGYGYPTAFFLPHPIQGREAWVENDRFGFRFFPRQLARRPPPLVIREKLASPSKPPPSDAEGASGTSGRGGPESRVFRIFVFGESAAMGDPDPSFSFSRMLQVLLRARYPGTRFEVFNTAFTAINSHAILPIARDSARLNGDLWIVYMGNNEVAGPFGPATVFGARAPGLPLIRASLALKEWKVGQWVDEQATRWRAETERSNVWTGLQMFAENHIPQNDPRLQRVYRSFERNLEDLLSAAKSAGTAVIVGTVASNLRDFPPFGSAHSETLAASQLGAWQTHFQSGTNAEAAGSFAAALEQYRAAAQIDAGFADLQFRIGRCLVALTNWTEARKAFEAARDLDTLRFRADSRLNEIIARVARDRSRGGVALVDAVEFLSRHAPSGIPGDELFFDHVHLTAEGNYRLALAFAEQIAQQLPAEIAASSAGPWASLEDCARQLALTDWARYQLVQSMQLRLLEAPFTNQWMHALRQQRFRERLTALQPGLDLNSLAAAEPVYREAVSRDPEDHFLRENFGRFLIARGDLDAALGEFKANAELLPHHPAAAYNLGHVLLLRGRVAEAAQEFQRALALRPDYAEAHNGIGQAHLKAGQTNDALAAFSRALKLKPDFADALLNLGQLWQNQGELQRAQEAYAKALELQPNVATTRLRLGNLLTQQGDLLQASRHFADAIRIQPDTAFPHFINAVRLNPDNAIAHFHLANALAARGDQAEAVKSLRKAIELNPGFWEARYLLGVEMATQNQLAEAEFQFGETVRLKPDFVLGHLNLGVAYARQSKWNEALQQFQRVLRLDPTNKQAQQYLDTLRKMARAP